MVEPGELEALGFFQGLSPLAREEVRAAFRGFEVGAHEDLLAEGESDRSMLVVLEGTLVATLGGVELARIGRGESAGEMTLFGSFDRRSATLTTLTPARALLLDDQGLKYLRLQGNPLARTLEVRALNTISRRLREANMAIARLAPGEPMEPPRSRGLLGRIATALGVSGDLPKTGPPDAVEVLRNSPGFVGRDLDVLRGLAARMELMAVPMGDTIVEEGREADSAYIIASGRVGVYCSIFPGRAERVGTLGAGYAFGQVALSDAGSRSATCRALDPCYLLRIPGDVYRQLEQENSRDGRTFRRGMIDGISFQLRLANEHLLSLHDDRPETSS